MRAVVQRCLEASVTVDGERISEIGPGLLVLLGVGQQDGEREISWLSRKVAQLRIFEDDAGKMNRSVLDVSKRVIVVSQFTLYADARQGNRPSFIDAGHPSVAEPLYEKFCEALRALGLEVQTGKFGADMKVALINDGPVTILLETPTATPPAV